jgi:DNA (cytosine-5)-methyltransferase 1
MGLVQTVQVQAAALSEEHVAKARECARLLHEYLPEQFPTPAELLLVGDYVLVDIMLRMLRPRELFRAQSFAESYIIDEILDPALLFNGGVQVADPLSVPRIRLTATAQVGMCGNSVTPVQAEALMRANFANEQLLPMAA